MGLNEMTRLTDSEELTYQMAYDLVDADEQAATRAGRAAPAAPQWIDLTGPDVFAQIKQRVGL